MTNLHIEDLDAPTEEHRVIEWRLEQFRLLGFRGPAAHLLAQRLTIDLELARRLAKAGCPPHLLLRIIRDD